MPSLANIASWNKADYQSVTADLIASMTNAQVAQMLQLYWLQPAAVAGFTAAQIPSIRLSWYEMSATWLNALTPAALAAIPIKSVGQLISTSIAGLDAAHTQALTAAQLDALNVASLSPASMAALTPAQITGMAAVTWGKFSAVQLNAMPVAVWAAVPAAAVGKFSSAVVAGLDVAHVQAFTAAQMATLCYPEKLSLAAVAALTPAQTAAISANLYGVSPAWLNALTPAALAAIPPKGINQIASYATVSGMDVTHVQALTAAQMAAFAYPGQLSLAAVAVLTPEQVAAISASFYSMSAAWLNALTPAALAAISTKGIGQLTAATIAGLDAAHTQALTATQLDALNVASLSPASMAALTPAQITGMSAVKWSSFSIAQINAISPSNFALMPVASLARLATTTIAGLDAVHAAALTGVQLAAISPSQFYGFTAMHIAALSANALAGLSVAQISWLSTAQVAALTGRQTAVLSVAQLEAMSRVQLGALSGPAVAGLSVTQLQSLGTRVSYLDTAGMAALSPASLAQLTFMQLSVLKPTQIAALTQGQLGALSAAQVNYLTPGQLAALDGHAQWLSPGAITGLNNVNLISIHSWLTADQRAALTPAQRAVVNQAGTAVTSLLQTLGTGSVRTQIEAVINSGESVFSYESLLKVLQGVDAGIGAGGLTQADMTDLKALVTAVGQSVGRDSYLYEISSNVVNGNRSNAWWTGGQATRVALGNLAAGSSADQMGKLIGKWFLGTDLPVARSSYMQYKAPLFSATGPLGTEVCQGGISDCYLMAGLVDVATDEPELIESMFTDNGNGTWGVRLYGLDDDPLYVTVNNQVPTTIAARSSQGNLWVPLIEKAYVEYEAQLGGEVNAYQSINGGWSSGLTAVTGKTTSDLWCSSLENLNTRTKNAVITALNSDQEVMYASFQDLNDPLNGKIDLVSFHMYAVLGYDTATDKMILRNPWGSVGGGLWNGTFELSMDQLGTGGDGGCFLVANEGSPASAIDPKYTVNAASVSQLVQAMALGDGGAAAITTLAGTGMTVTSPVTLLAAAV